MEQRVWQEYKDKGVHVVAIDANGDELEGVQAFVANLPTSYPIGLEDPETKTYEALTQNFKGANPFPVDVVVAPDGKIVYIAREYDPEGIIAAIEALLDAEPAAAQ
jgi:hypothetical protein